MEKKTKSVEKMPIKLSKINNRYKLPLKFKRSNNIFLSLPKLDTNKSNSNCENKIRTIVIDKKLSNNILSTITNKKISRNHSQIKAKFTGFCVIPKTSKNVQIEKIDIPVTFSEPTNFKKNINFFTCNKNNYTSLYFQKPITDRIENIFYDSRKKYPVGKIISTSEEKNLNLNSQIYRFAIGSKYFPNIKSRKSTDKFIFKERIKKMIEDGRTKRMIKRKTPMNCRQVLEDIKNQRYSQTRRLLQEVIDESHKTKNDMAVFFDDFKKCKEFNDCD